MLKNTKKQGLPWWLNDKKNPPANARDMGSIPGLGRSHMPWSNQACVPQLLSLWFSIWEPQPLSPQAWSHAQQQEQPPQWEAHALQLERAPACHS